MSSKTGYGAVPQADPEEALVSTTARDVSFCLPHACTKLMEGAKDDAHATKYATPSSRRDRGLVDETAMLQFKVAPESWRFLAYIFFWFMCLFAILLTKFFVAPALAAGPVPEGSTCPPFQTGTGFDIYSNSHLMRTFGFNNICVNWDYTPSRELTALVYPLFEYALLIYIILDFASSALWYKKGLVSRRYWIVAQIFFPIEMILCAWFRMIFVMLAYVNVQGHTAGFLGLQIALVLVAIENVIFILETKPNYGWVGGIVGTHRVAWTYLIGDLLISAVKLGLTAYVVFTGSYPTWAQSASIFPDKTVGQVIDIVWMIFNAILPLIISFVRARHEKPLVITIDLAKLPEFV